MRKRNSPDKSEASMGCVRETPHIKMKTSTGYLTETPPIKIKPAWDV